MNYPNIEKLGPLDTIRNLRTSKEKLRNRALTSLGMSVPFAMSVGESYTLGVTGVIASLVCTAAEGMNYIDISSQETVFKSIILKDIEYGDAFRSTSESLTE